MGRGRLSPGGCHTWGRIARSICWMRCCGTRPSSRGRCWWRRWPWACSSRSFRWRRRFRKSRFPTCPRSSSPAAAGGGGKLPEGASPTAGWLAVDPGGAVTVVATSKGDAAKDCAVLPMAGQIAAALPNGSGDDAGGRGICRVSIAAKPVSDAVCVSWRGTDAVGISRRGAAADGQFGPIMPVFLSCGSRSGRLLRAAPAPRSCGAACGRPAGTGHAASRAGIGWPASAAPVPARRQRFLPPG